VKRAVVGCVEGALDFYYDAQLSEVVIEFSSFKRPFSLLSDGQRCMMAMIGDIAQKAAKLNPQLGERVLDDTPGVVLIDELDLHLHPLWQRRVVEDLRTTFKSIQFICSTHSPFLIQSLRSGEELLMLDGQPTADLANMSIGTIAQGIQGVENTDVSLRYNEMQKAAEWYLETLDESQDCEGERLQEIKKQLSDELSKYADNPTFQAFLEMKRVVKLGS
jgi:predicted ATP-binding protein involved in virulence